MLNRARAFRAAARSSIAGSPLRLVEPGSSAALPWAAAERARAGDVGLGDLDADALRIIEETRPYTLTSPERVAALCAAVDYVVEAQIPGAVVECGVWRGGSLMAAALRLLSHGVSTRDLFAFDTFAGMSRPTELDVDYLGKSWREWDPPGRAEPEAELAEVRSRLLSTGYPRERLTFVAGDVAETLPAARSPNEIALLRLDTDWYESTRVELLHLYPRLVPGGVLIVDDYGHYLGARAAVDEYFRGQRIFLQRIDYTGRIAVKQQD
jgi:O-methyltransferase